MSVPKAAIDITRYKIISKVGEGSFSNVYRVKDLQTNKYYAAKVSKIMIDEETKDSSEVLSLFREVNLMSLLNHPCVLTFVGYYCTNFEEEPLPTIITEFSTNGSLYDIIKLETQGLSPDEWTFTKKLINIYGIASGMSYLHSHNVLHRDLKPENVLLNDYLQPKISDFGLSKINDFISMSMNVQSLKGLKGTPIYMSPEILSDEIYSKSSDVYAFAFVVYQILTCKEPFKNIGMIQLMNKIVNEGSRPEIGIEIPKAYREMIEKCWSQKPEERPTFDEIVKKLRTNVEFITNDVDENEFFDYVDFIDKYKNTFDVTKKIIRFSDFICNEGRNKNIKPILFNEELLNEDNNNNNDDEHEYENKFDSIEEKSTKSTTKKETEIKNELNRVKEESTKNSSKPSKIGEKAKIVKTQKINENEISSNKIKEEEQNEAHNLKYPFNEFVKLSKLNQTLVEEAETRSDKQFEVGKFLIEGQNDFPMNINLGLQYIEQSVNKQNNDAIIYYIEILIKGKIIKEDLNKANEYLSKLDQAYEQDKYYFQGIIKYKQNKFKESSQIFKEGINKGSFICMYKYGKMLFTGEITENNNNDFIQYFNQSKDQGYKKSEYFLTSFNKLKKVKDFSKLPPETQLIFITNNIRNIINNPDAQYSQFQLNPKQTEKLFFNKSIKSPIFYEILKRYENISIEIEYQSSSFRLIFDLVTKISKKKLKNLNIGIVFTSLSGSISNECFSKDISYHQIESYIQIIPKRMFIDCRLLKEIIIPSSVVEIGEYAFYDCFSLTQITIPSSVTKIGEGAFSCCKSLTQITIHSSLTQIESNVFDGCSLLTQITIPSSVTQIGEGAFSGCESLTQITIPSSVTKIGFNTFNGCLSLKQITIPSSVIEIGGGVFNECIKLDEIEILPGNENKFQYYQRKFLICKSDSSSVIYDSLISFTSDGEIIDIPPFIKIILPHAFSGCSSLTQITIPSSVTQIGERAFYLCSSLIQIEIPSSVTKIESNVFNGCTSLTQITIPSSVTEIGTGSFFECLSLKQIEIPSSVMVIGNQSFSGCSSLKEIKIPSSVTQIGSGSFYGCSLLKEIIIPSSVTQIESETFYGCSSLNQITIPSSITQIGSNAFYGCSSLKKITIPSSVALIGSNAFSYCSLLKEVLILSSETQIGSNAFSGCSSLKEIKIPSSSISNKIGFDPKVKI